MRDHGVGGDLSRWRVADSVAGWSQRCDRGVLIINFYSISCPGAPWLGYRIVFFMCGFSV
jgi:hypothetical protein